jgi:RecJ-like exonuclease
MNTITRHSASAVQFNDISVVLASLRMTADQASKLIQAIAGCIKGDGYESFGSVDLSDVANTMQDEIAAFAEPSTCGNCSGSGEGQTDGSTCRACHGQGEIPSVKQQGAYA